MAENSRAHSHARAVAAPQQHDVARFWPLARPWSAPSVRRIILRRAWTFPPALRTRPCTPSLRSSPRAPTSTSTHPTYSPTHPGLQMPTGPPIPRATGPSTERPTEGPTQTRTHPAARTAPHRMRAPLPQQLGESVRLGCACGSTTRPEDPLASVGSAPPLERARMACPPGLRPPRLSCQVVRAGRKQRTSRSARCLRRRAITRTAVPRACASLAHPSCAGLRYML